MATATEPAKDEKAETKEKKEVEYAAFRSISGTQAEIVSAIEKELAGNEGTVMIFIGTARVTGQPGPKLAMRAVGEHRDLDGDYAVAASSAVKHFPGLKSAVVRDIAGL